MNGIESMGKASACQRNYRDDKELNDLMWKVSKPFDSQCIDNEREFADVGFKTKEEKKQFKQNLIRFRVNMKEALKHWRANANSRMTLIMNICMLI